MYGFGPKGFWMGMLVPAKKVGAGGVSVVVGVAACGVCGCDGETLRTLTGLGLWPEEVTLPTALLVVEVTPSPPAGGMSAVAREF